MSSVRTNLQAHVEREALITHVSLVVDHGPFVAVKVSNGHTDGVSLLVTDPEVLDRLADVVRDAAFDLRSALADRAATAA